MADLGNDAASRGRDRVAVQRFTMSRPETGRPRRRIVGILARLVVVGCVLGSFWLFFRLPEFLDAAGFDVVSVAGRVTLEGVPPESARVVFVPLERNRDQGLQPISVATVGRDGTFELKTLAGKPGAVRGRHLVFVLPAPDLSEVESGEGPAGDPTAAAPPDQLDAWREAASLLGYWVAAAPVREHVTVPFLGTRTLEITLKRQESMGLTN